MASCLRRGLLAFLSVTMVLMAASTAWCQRPPTAELLPDRTLVYVRIPSIPDAIERLQQTATGRIAEDPAIRGLIEQLYGSAAQEFEQLEDQFGLSLDQIMRLPQGEICFALVAEDDGPISVVLIVDVGTAVEDARTLLDHGEQFAESQGASRESETLGDTDLRILNGGDADERVAYFIRDNSFCLSNNPDVARTILARWDGTAEEKRLFAENRKFLTIMNRCKTVDEQDPQLVWFVDPIEIVRVSAQQSFAGRAGLAFIPTIGLDGLLAIGGTTTLVSENFDDVTHIHVLLSSPRKGIMEMIAMRPGETDPPDWVPLDAVSYTTINWDIDQTYYALEELIDGFRGEGFMATQVQENISDEIGYDFKEEILDKLTGRLTYVQWMEPPARVNSQTNLIGIQLADPSTAQEILDSFIAQVDSEGNLSEQSYRSISYYRAPGPQQQREEFLRERGQDFEPEETPFEIRDPTPSFGIVGDHLLICDSETCFKAAVDAMRDPDKSLADDPDFQFVESEIRRLIGTSYPGALHFNRPEESLRFMFELAGSDNTRDLLRRGGEEVRAIEILGNALEDNPLPDFEDLAKYLAPGGGMITNDETGIHITLFTLRRD